MDNARGHTKQIQHSIAPQRAGPIFRRTREMDSAAPHAQDDALISCEVRDHEVAEGRLACAEAKQQSPYGKGQRAPMQRNQTKHLLHVQGGYAAASTGPLSNLRGSGTSSAHG